MAGPVDGWAGTGTPASSGFLSAAVNSFRNFYEWAWGYGGPAVNLDDVVFESASAHINPGEVSTAYTAPAESVSAYKHPRETASLEE